MKNPCAGHQGDYFNHACYNTLKDYFNKINLTRGGQEYLDNSIKALENNVTDTSPYYNIFQEITRHYDGDHAFTVYGNIPSCIYINYWLNKYIQEKNSSLYNEISFKIFNEFDTNYSKLKYNIQNNSCKKYIRLLNTDEYRRMNILYLLYHYYDQLVSPNLKNDTDLQCTYVSLLAKYYRNIILFPDEYKDLFSQLKSLKDLIVKSESDFKLKCTSSFSLITLPKEDTPNSVGHHGKQDTKVKLPVVSPTDPSDVLGKSSDRMTVTDLVTLPQQPNPELTESSPAGKPVTEETVENQNLLTAKGETHYAGSIREGVHGVTQNAQYPRLPEEKFTEERVEDPYNILDVFHHKRLHQVESDTHPKNTVSPTSQPDNVGLLGKIQSTLSGIVSEVEPAPILGVSGGMGALFLLLRYTPVGSFFGGRRRQIRQILSSIRGYSPGKFPNLHGYDGGYIGYGPIYIPYQAE